LQTEPIGKIFERQNKVSEELAKQKTYEEDPIRAKTGDILNRDTVQTVFDMGFFATQLLMDRKKLASVLINPSKYAGQVGKLKMFFLNLVQINLQML
jgi:hypothetical protein